MSLPPDELERVKSREIFRVLDFYNKSFTIYLAIAISYTEKIPEEMNNTIRNAFSHLARLRDAHQEESIRAEGQKAIDHIERANRDCLKAAILHAHAALEDLILDVIFHHGRLTPALDGQRSRLREERKLAYIAETRGESGQTEKLVLHLQMIEYLSEEIKRHYPEAGGRLTRWRRFMKRWFHPVGYLVIGTALGVLARHYLDLMISRFY
ncbi:MAG: hypothetical protein HQL97_05080 [Magnetococcales bacterium]|nr:hypothetical protein [Magnetococcales bacterium]MBF0261201.1 hypothetical protein [Magnetococcales bacterium]